MKNKILVIIFFVFIVLFDILGILIKDNDVSILERRKLITFSKVVSSSNKSISEFTDNLDKYLVEQIPLRDFFININIIFNRYILCKKDYNDAYIINDYIIEKNYPANEKNVNKFVDKINYIIDNDLKDSNVYFSIIPDKAYFIDNKDVLKINYNELFNKIENGIHGKNINIRNSLELSDYYRTDLHWKQENILDISNILLDNMINKKDINKLENFKINTIDNFYGASYSKAGIKIKPDKITYLTNDILDNVKVNHLEFGDKNLYDLTKNTSMDKYDIFLSGATSYTEIINPNSNENKELVIFRDSFTSCIAPLLISSYSKITLIDLRYIDYRLIDELIDFEGKDVLFLYSSLIINNSSLLKVFY